MMYAPYDQYVPVSAGDWWFGPLMMLAWFLFLIIIIVFAARVFRHGGEGHWHMHSRDPLDTIKDRYAKGEITKEEYEQLKRDLQ